MNAIDYTLAGLPQKQALFQIAADFELFHNAENKGFATISRNNHLETYAIRSSQFRNVLSSIYYAETKVSIGKAAMQDAIDTLEAKAIHEGAAHKVFFRMGELEGNIYVDLGDADYSTVRITQDGWQACNDSNIKFIRTNAMQALPMPIPGGNMNDFRPFVNVASDADFRLLIAWILCAFRKNIPYPILIVQGEQGTGKTELCKFVRALIDPSSTSLRTMPRNERDLVVTASNNHVLAFDNLSGISNDLSDALCRISTGGGFTSRQLYSDGDEFVMEAKRPQIVNGIDDIALRPDLSDRAVILNLPMIEMQNRKSTTALWNEFDAIRPHLIGAILNALAAGLKNLPNTELAEKPRMADFALWVAAMEQHLGWDTGGFMDAYNLNRAASIEAAIENNILIQAIIAMLDFSGKFNGTVMELLNKLKLHAPDGCDVSRDYMWPKNPTALSKAIRRIAPQLRHINIECDFNHKTNKGRMVIIKRNV